MSIYTVFLFFVVYFICSINPAIIICKLKTGEDIRRLGSGNAGPTNSMRVLGRPLGVLIIILDVLKVVASYMAILLLNKLFKTDFSYMVGSSFILGAVFGDCFPAYYGLKGGKGIVSGISVMALLDPQSAVICFAASLIVILLTRTVSKGTLAGLVLFVIMCIVMKKGYIFSVIIVSLVIMFKHRENIYRIFTKQEGKM